MTLKFSPLTAADVKLLETPDEELWMANELAQRLRDGTKITCGWPGEDVIDPLLYEAADEIERLQKRVTEARAILEPIAEFDPELRDEIREWLK